MEKKPIVIALGELKRAMAEISFITWFLDTIVVFTLANLVLLLLTMHWAYALVPAGIYSAVHGFGVFRTVKIKHAEEKVPELSEQLITVADHVAEDNTLLQSLNAEVLEKMKQIRTSYFFSFGRLSRELLMLFICSFLIIGASAYGVHFINIDDVVKEVREFRNAGFYDVDSALLGFEEGNPEEDEIFGDKNIAELGNEEMQLELNPLLSDADISQVKDPEHRKFNSNVPREISASTDASFEESIPKGYQKIVKNYFHQISKTS